MSKTIHKAATKWSEARFRHLAEVRKGRLPSSANGSTLDAKKLPYLTMEYLRGEIHEPPLVAIESDLLLASDDDILLLWDGSNAGEFLRAKRGVVSSTAALVTPKSVDPAFFFWACKAQEHRVRSETIGMGIPHVNGDFLANLRVQLPDINQQRTIACYLDRETARLDVLIAEKERLLCLLSDKRRALIVRAVTCGLDPNVPFLDSDIPWLGKTPMHWELIFLRFACRSIETGGTPPSNYMDATEENSVDWFTPCDFGNNFVLHKSARRLSQEAIFSGEAKLFPAGSVFVVSIGATLGKVGIIEAPASANQQINVMIPKGNVDPHFLGYVLWGLGDIMTAMANSATLPILNQQKMGEIRVPIPPYSEQIKIVSYIEEQTKNLDNILASSEQAISLLKERRSALVYATISGQLEVR